MNEAIRNGHAWSKDNTCVTYDPTNNMSAEVFLHGNHIATVTDDSLKLYSGGGWFTLIPLSPDSMHLLMSFANHVQMEFFRKIGTGTFVHLIQSCLFMMALLSPWCNDIKRQTEKREDGTNRLSIFHTTRVVRRKMG